MTTPIDPWNVFVVAVGLEKYDYGPAFDLPGAAAAADRFARWALGCGVPADQIVLACSRLAAPHGTDPDPELSGAPTVGTTRDELESLFQTTVPTRTDRLLLMYWCGHGVLNDVGERAVFTSDATQESKRNINVAELLRLLGSQSLHGFGEQVLFFDVCANYLHTGPYPLRWTPDEIAAVPEHRRLTDGFDPKELHR